MKYIKIEACYRCPYYYSSALINYTKIDNRWCLKTGENIENNIIIQNQCPLEDYKEASHETPA